MIFKIRVVKVLLPVKCTVHAVVETILRLMIAFTFIMSGLMKGVNLHAVVQTVINYCGLFNLTPNSSIAFFIAFSVCLFEILIGMLAVDIRIYRKLYPIYLIVISIFTFLTYVNLESPLGNFESCGCFGEIITIGATGTFVKNIILLCMATLLDIIMIMGRNSDSNINQNYSIYRYLLIYGLISLFPILFSALFMDKINANVYLSFYVAISILSVLIAITVITQKSTNQ